MTKEKKLILLKTTLVLLSYLIFTNVIVGVLNALGFNHQIACLFIADVIFFFGIVFAYRKDIKDDLKEFAEKYKIKSKISIILKWALLLFIVNIIMGALCDVIFPNATQADGNTSLFNSILDISFFYAVFKALIFATIAEELVFKKSLRDAVDNNVVFIIISGLFYTVMNMAYTDLTQAIVYFDAIGYFLFAVVSCLAYVKYNNNIVIIMLIKFVYQLIPLAVLITVASGV